MMMMSILILVVSAMLVGQSMAVSMHDDGSLIKHPTPEEKLERNQLIEQLSLEDLYEIYKGRVAEYVAEQLYAAKDKATTEVFEELTVQSLIDLNQVELSSCSSKILNKRHEKFDEIYQLDHHERPFELLFGVIVYVITANLKTFTFCSENREQVISQGIATKAELKEALDEDDEFDDVPEFTPAIIEGSSMEHAIDLLSAYSGSLIKHPVNSGKLDKDQLIEKLSVPNLHELHKGGVAEYVAEQLYSAKDKARTEVLEGVTVRSLIEVNTVVPSRCSKRSMDKVDSKLESLSKINPKGEKFELVFGIFEFVKQAELMIVEYCMRYRDLVLDNHLADTKQMDTFIERFASLRKDDHDDDIDFRKLYEMGSLTSTTTEKFEEVVAREVDELFHLRD